MLSRVGSEPGSLPGRRREIDARLKALRARLKELRERDWNAANSRSAAPSDRLEAAPAPCCRGGRYRRTIAGRKCGGVRQCGPGARAYRRCARQGSSLRDRRRAHARRACGASPGCCRRRGRRAERALSLLPGPEPRGLLVSPTSQTTTWPDSSIGRAGSGGRGTKLLGVS